MDVRSTLEIIHNENNKKSIKIALKCVGFSEQACETFLKCPSNLLWAGIFEYLKSKEENTIMDNLSILSKLKIINDPGNQLKQLNCILAQQRIIVDLLLCKEKIDITIEILLVVINNLKILQTSSIENCLNSNSQEWLRISQQYLNQDVQVSNSIPLAELRQLYNKLTDKDQEPIAIEVFLDISKQLCQECKNYSHNEYQCTIAAILASSKDKFLIAIIPTGQGKTWIQALLAKFYCNQNQKVTIVEPSEPLQIQTAEKIGATDYRVTVSTAQWFYQYLPKNDIILIDEYDEIATNQPFTIVNNSIIGLWALKERKTIAFSATSTPALEKLINNTVTRPKIYHFPSQYEMQNGISHLQIGNINCQTDEDKLISALKQDIVKHYDLKPIIIILEDHQNMIVQNFLKHEKMRYLIGGSEQNILAIRQWEYGVLILKGKDARGLDTKFAKDSVVFIIAEVENELQYQQYLGRSSRNLGAAEGVMYCCTNESSNQILNKLTRQNFAKYQNLEYLIKLLSYRNQNEKLIDALQKAFQEKKLISKLDEIKEYVGKKTFQNLMKGIQL